VRQPRRRAVTHADRRSPATRRAWLNQPGFTNADNKPLAEKLVTLSRGDLITFK